MISYFAPIGYPVGMKHFLIPTSRKVARHLGAVVVALGLCGVQAGLASTGEDVVSAELLPGWQTKNGQHVAALSLQLLPKWKTYWRSPGDAGIPPEFNWSGSQNVKSVRVLWPSPSVFHSNGMRTIGYHDAVVLPLEVVPIDPSKPVQLKAQVDMGVCKDICVPAQIDVQGLLGGIGQKSGAISAALHELPQEARAAGVGKISCSVSPVSDGLRLTASMVLAVQGAEETVVFEARDRSIWVSEAETSRSGNVLTASADFVASGGAAFALDRSGVTVTVLHEGGSVEIKGCPAP